MDRMAGYLNRNVDHIKDDMRRTAERLWNVDSVNRDRLDPVVDLLLGAFAQEIFALQQEVIDHKRRTMEIAVQAMLPEELTAPSPAYAVMQGKPVDPGTWTHRTLTAFSATHAMDVHDRVGTSFAFTPVDEFRLYNGAVRHLAFADKFFSIDARTGQRRNISVAERRALPAHEFWIGLELNEPIDASAGLPLFFSLPTDDPDARSIIPQLASCRFDLAGARLEMSMGIAPRVVERATMDAIIDPVRTREQEAVAYHAPQFITLRPGSNAMDSFHNSSAPSPSGEGSRVRYKEGLNYERGLSDPFKPDAPAPVTFTHVFGPELTKQLDGRIKWLRMTVPASMDPRAVVRLQCAMNCFPVINRKRYERTASNSRLLSLTHAPELQFWAISNVVDGKGRNVLHERQVPSANGTAPAPSYALRKGGMERIDEREAYERLMDLLHVVRNDHAAFAALDEAELAQGLTHVKAWLEEYRTRHAGPAYPPTYLMFSDAEHRNTHVDYWATNGTVAAKLPALKPFRLDSGAYLGDCRLITAPVGGEDTPGKGTLRDRLRAVVGSRSNALPTVFMVKAMCMNALPEELRDKVLINVRRDVGIGEGADTGFVRNLHVRVVADTVLTTTAVQWNGYCDHIRTLLNEQFKGLLPITVRFEEQR